MIKLEGLTYLAIGAVLYWLFWGNPTTADIIPFVGMMFLWPFFLIFKAMWIVMWVALFAIVCLVCYLIYEHFRDKWENRKFRSRAQQNLDRRTGRPL